MTLYCTGPHSGEAVLSIITPRVGTQKIGMRVSLSGFGFEGNGDFRSYCPRFG